MSAFPQHAHAHRQVTAASHVNTPDKLWCPPPLSVSVLILIPVLILILTLILILALLLSSSCLLRHITPRPAPCCVRQTVG